MDRGEIEVSRFRDKSRNASPVRCPWAYIISVAGDECYYPLTLELPYLLTLTLGSGRLNMWPPRHSMTSIVPFRSVIRSEQSSGFWEQKLQNLKPVFKKGAYECPLSNMRGGNWSCFSYSRHIWREERHVERHEKLFADSENCAEPWLYSARLLGRRQSSNQQLRRRETVRNKTLSPSPHYLAYTICARGVIIRRPESLGLFGLTTRCWIFLGNAGGDSIGLQDSALAYSQLHFIPHL